MIVEDNSTHIQAFVEIMKTLEYQYTLCENANEATKQFKETLSENLLYDMIFLKLIMPGTDGYDAAKELR